MKSNVGSKKLSIDTFAGCGPSEVDIESVPDGSEIEIRITLGMQCIAGEPHPRTATLGDETGELASALAADYSLIQGGIRD